MLIWLETSPTKGLYYDPMPIIPMEVKKKLVEQGSQKGKGIAVFTRNIIIA